MDLLNRPFQYYRSKMTAQTSQTPLDLLNNLDAEPKTKKKVATDFKSQQTVLHLTVWLPLVLALVLVITELTGKVLESQIPGTMHLWFIPWFWIIPCLKLFLGILIFVLKYDMTYFTYVCWKEMVMKEISARGAIQRYGSSLHTDIWSSILS